MRRTEAVDGLFTLRIDFARRRLVAGLAVYFASVLV